MSWRRHFAKIAALFYRRKPADDLKEEIRAHLAMEEQEILARGMPPEEARYAALRRFGNVTLAKERSREMWNWQWLDTLFHATRYGLRQLRRNPGFASVAILTLALGIGANLVMFSVVRGVLLRPLPYHDPSKLVEVYISNPSHGTAEGSFSPQDIVDFRSQAKSFESSSGYWYEPGMSLYTLLSQGEPTVIETVSVDSNFLATLGVAPALGRGFIPEENIHGKDNVVILSNSLWRERFDGDRQIIGKPIRIGGGEFVVVGVMGPEFRFPSPDVGFWVPLSQVTDDVIP